MQAPAFKIRVFNIGENVLHLQEEPGFSHTCLTHDPDNLPGTGSGFIAGFDQGLHLPCAANEFCEALDDGGLDSCLHLLGFQKLVGSLRGILAFYFYFTQALKIKKAPRKLVGVFRYKDGAGFGYALHPCSNIGGISNGRIIHPEIIPDGADDYRPGVKAYPHLEI